MLKGAVPYDANVVARNAGYLEVLSKMPWDGFAESTKGQRNTIALPAIWTDAAKFKQAQDQFQNAVGALVAASKSGDEAKVKAAIGDVGKACGSCHDNFREKQ
jgi:cytochrome c556